jgi:hypothetical protein
MKQIFYETNFYNKLKIIYYIIYRKKYLKKYQYVNMTGFSSVGRAFDCSSICTFFNKFMKGTVGIKMSLVRIRQVGKF